MLHLRFAIYDFFRRAGGPLVGCALLVGLAGCGVKMLDPTQIGRFRPTPAVNVILDSLGVAEEPAVAWEIADEPRPEDIRAVTTDYVLQPGDTVQVTIYELLQESLALVNNYVVTETGKLSIPEVGPIQAAGLTERQLEEEIRRILSPAILRNPSVTVTVVNSQRHVFSILGNGVPAPGRYPLPRSHDFRLTDALAVAQVQMQFNVSHVYVSRREEAVAMVPERRRQTPGGVPELELIQPGSPRVRPQSMAPRPGSPGTTTQQMDIPEPSEPAQRFETEREMLEMIQPQARSNWPQSRKVIAGPTGASRQNEEMSASMLPGGFRLLGSPSSPTPQRTPPRDVVQTPVEFGTLASPAVQSGRGQGAPEPQMEWHFRDGRWVQVPAQGATTTPAPATVGPRGPVPLPDGGTLPMDLEWEQAIQTRLIRIPADRLLAGDPKYNIVVRPGDTIHVPVDLIGEFYIGGNVNRAGTLNLTGRPITLKQAIAAAGGLGPLAAPKRVEVIRRIGTNREQIVMVDLDRIASGEQPDFFVKPNDLINVGTDATSRWRAVLRNAFRATYGFGFVYDRNFADIDYGEGFPWADDF